MRGVCVYTRARARAHTHTHTHAHTHKRVRACANARARLCMRARARAKCTRMCMSVCVCTLARESTHVTKLQRSRPRFNRRVRESSRAREYHHRKLSKINRKQADRLHKHGLFSYRNSINFCRPGRERGLSLERR